MYPLIAIALIVLALIVNAAALYVGNERNTKLYNAATLLGGVGLFAFLGLAVAFLDAFMQIWVRRPGYEGQPVIFFLVLWGASSIGSLISVGVILIKEARSEV